MKIEDQVCSFEQAKKLPQIGDSLFVWVKKNPDSNLKLMSREDWFLSKEVCRRFPWDAWDAYTVAELGVLLGRYQVVKVHDYEADEEYWSITNLDNGLDIVWLPGDFDGKGENEARADALIWLLDNGHLKAEDLKL